MRFPRLARRGTRRPPSIHAYRQLLLSATGARQGTRWTFHLPIRLESPNVWGSERTAWRKTAARAALRTHLQIAYLHAGGPLISTKHSAGETRRMRVTVTRLVPKSRNFIRDGDNRRACTKPLNDALQDLGLLFEDSERWLEQPMPDQAISPDGFDWTVVTLEPAESTT